MHLKNKHFPAHTHHLSKHVKGVASLKTAIIIVTLCLAMVLAGITLPEAMIANGVIVISLTYLAYAVCFQFPFQNSGQRGVLSAFFATPVAEAKNRKDFRRALALVSHVPLAVWDEQSTLVECNENFAKAMGLKSPDNLIGKTLNDLLENAGYQTCSLELGATFLRQKDGLLWQVALQPLDETHSLTILQDARAFQDMQERLAKYEGEITRLYHCLDEKQKQCLAAEKKVRESASIRSDFMANVSHELRTPLNAIIGFSEVMTSGVFGPLGSRKYYDYCRDISESGHGLLRVINDVLDMSRLETGTFELNKQAMRLDQVCLDSLGLLSIESEKKNIHFKSEIDDAIPMVADQRALKQILLNVFSNAAKFTPKNGTVAVRARTVGSDVLITVADSGVGIPRSALKQLARPFEQVQNQMTKNHKGWGLGLAIARSLVEMHGGQLRLASREKVGTIVSIRMPQDQHSQSS
jgi:two-component system cell cycle sensor histidine kinase PleC